MAFTLSHLALLFVDKCLALSSLLLPPKNRPSHDRVLEKDSVTVEKLPPGTASQAVLAGICSCNLACVKIWKGPLRIPALQRPPLWV